MDREDEDEVAGDEAFKTSLGKAIAIRRLELGLKRNDLRDRSGLSYPYIAELENGAKRASSKTLAAVARALELSPSELLARAEALDDVRPSADRFDDAELASRRSWFRTALAPAAPVPQATAASAASAPPAPPPPAAAPAPERRRPPRAEPEEPVTEDRVREIVLEELRAAGLLPEGRRRRK